MGSGSPISPVEQTISCEGFNPNSLAAAAAIALASSTPCFPVLQFELPLLAMMARTSVLDLR